MKMFVRVLFIGYLILGFSGYCMAQETEEIRKVKTENGEFIIHTVDKGQTLYAISKMYSVSVDDIVSANPELDNFGIRIGQTLRVPVKDVNRKEAKRSSVKLSGDTIYHEVLKKETLYALSKKYQISVEELETYNPELADGLKIGMVVKIPSVPEQDSLATEIDFRKPAHDSLTLHEVLPKQTLYSLSKEYGVTADSIQMVNEGMTEGLKVGATIRIPVLSPDFVSLDTLLLDTIDTISHTLLYPNDTLKIGVFLPFCTKINLDNQRTYENDELYKSTQKSLMFMRGFNLAMDSLVRLGYNVDVVYFDTKKDSLTCKMLANETDFTGFKLFVGPIFQSNFEYLASKAKELRIPIVSPTKISSKLLLDNKFVVKSHSSSTSQVVHLANFMGSHYQDSNVVIIQDGNDKDKRNAVIFQKHFNNQIDDSVAIHRIWQATKGNYQSLIKKGTVNYVAVISNNQAFVSATLSVFYQLIDSKTEIRVFGLDSWQYMEAIDLGYLQALEVTYPVQQSINYSSVAVDNFISDYRAKYYSDPTINGFKAFDIGLYFGNAMFLSGGNWEEYISNHPKTGLSLGFDLIKIGEQSGYENQGGFMMQNYDYELHLVR